MKVVASWSSGKDSAWMLHVLSATHPGAVQSLLTTTNSTFGRVAMHGVRHAVLDAQAAAVGLPLYIVQLPWPCSDEQYAKLLGAAVNDLAARGFTHMAFGDLFLEDVRRYREERLTGTGLEPLFPLWRSAGTRELARMMIASGLRATIVTVDPLALAPAFAGRTFDDALLADLPASVDPCGENGEFHTCVWDGPMFARPLDLIHGEIVARDGFVFADVLPRGPTDPLADRRVDD